MPSSDPTCAFIGPNYILISRRDFFETITLTDVSNVFKKSYNVQLCTKWIVHWNTNKNTLKILTEVELGQMQWKLLNSRLGHMLLGQMSVGTNECPDCEYGPLLQWYCNIIKLVHYQQGPRPRRSTTLPCFHKQIFLPSGRLVAGDSPRQFKTNQYYYYHKNILILIWYWITTSPHAFLAVFSAISSSNSPP